MWAPALGVGQQFLGLRHLLRLVGDAVAVPDAKIVRRKNIGPPSLKMSIISTVQRPTPRTWVSRSMISASDILRIARRLGMVPSSVFAAMSRKAAIFAHENPAARKASSLTVARSLRREISFRERARGSGAGSSRPRCR